MTGVPIGKARIALVPATAGLCTPPMRWLDYANLNPSGPAAWVGQGKTSRGRHQRGAPGRLLLIAGSAFTCLIWIFVFCNFSLAIGQFVLASATNTAYIEHTNDLVASIAFVTPTAASTSCRLAE
ncbi:hypothetical protein ACLKMY_40315 [Paraburkholderia mimosarum]|uniref:hypothetical protein n=1 Tax=Paraburkholderia mimosarum TaxID=312026 RepID=UPI000483C2AB|nr:hypothetical protein [Paraburkholderia mimosarum]